ncbi:MAG: DUF4157 domain-containing protein [Bacteroidota bacterium]
MRTFAQKPKVPQQVTSALSTVLGRAHFGQSCEVSPNLQLQRSIGNHARGRLPQTHAQEPEDESGTSALPSFAHDFSRIPVYAPTGTQSTLMPMAASEGFEHDGDRQQNATGMPASVRSKMEHTLGADFSDVRVHSESSRAAELGATAFTQGDDIYAARDTWTPETTRGQEILGHELVHVMQQRAGRVGTTLQMNGTHLNDEPTLEREADVLGRFAARSSPRPTNTNHHTTRPMPESYQSASPRSHDGAEGVAQRTLSHRHAPKPHRPQVGGVCQLLGASASPWWPVTQSTRTVTIDDHDFDFKPGGIIDGPLSHNGVYKILENQLKTFKMELHVGTDDAQSDDLNVTLLIKDGQATITGSVKAKKLEPPASASVKGSGTKSNPFHLDFADKDKKNHSIVWQTA